VLGQTSKAPEDAEEFVFGGWIIRHIRVTMSSQIQNKVADAYDQLPMKVCDTVMRKLVLRPISQMPQEAIAVDLGLPQKQRGETRSELQEKQPAWPARISSLVPGSPGREALPGGKLSILRATRVVLVSVLEDSLNRPACSSYSICPVLNHSLFKRSNSSEVCSV